MDKRLVTALRVLAGVLVFATAAYHLAWGLPRALIYLDGIGFLLSQGALPDLRPFLFVIFALALFAGPYLVTRDVISLRRGYQLGMLAMVLSIAAWATWHLTDHAAFLYPANAEAASDAAHTGPIETIIQHYLVEPVEGAIKTIELGGAMAFGALLRWDPAVRGDRGESGINETATEKATGASTSDSNRPEPED